MKIVIFGSNGFLGRKLFEHLSREHEVFCADRNPRAGNQKVDATNYEEVDNFLSEVKPEIVIDTIALTSSVACEKDPELCEKTNYLTAKNIAKVCNRIGAKMVFISSSYVFDGQKGNYNEMDPPTPTINYAKTKIMAEEEVSRLDDFLILRVDVMYGIKDGRVRFGSGTFERDRVEVGFPDQVRQPLYVDDVPRVILELDEKKAKGIFHVAGPGRIKMVDFLHKLGVLENAEDKIKIVDGSNWVIKSPLNSSLDITKLNSLGINTTSFESALGQMRKQLGH